MESHKRYQNNHKQLKYAIKIELENENCNKYKLELTQKMTESFDLSVT